MFGIGVPELMIIAVIIFVIFGVGKLPEIGQGLGSGFRNFKKSISEDPSTDDVGDQKRIDV